MPEISASQLLIPENWNEFEKICADLFEEMWGPATSRYGRSGQRQKGIDIFGPGGKAVQCKGKRAWPPTRLTITQVKDAVKEAKKYRPALTELWIVTTADDDVAIQDCAGAITRRHAKLGLFSVHVLGWSELCRRFKRSPQILANHFGQVAFSAVKTSVDNMAAIVARMTEEFPEILSQLRSLQPAASSAQAIPDVFLGALERDLQYRYRVAYQRQPFPEIEKANEFGVLAGEVLDPRNSMLPSELRRKILLRASRTASTRGDPDEAERLLTEARALAGSEPDVVAVARLAQARGDPDKAIRMLRDESDPDSRASLLSILTKARGDSAALAWLSKEKLGVGDLTGMGAVVLCQIYLRTKDWDELQRMADRTSKEQCIEYPFLRFLRGQIRFSLTTSEEDRGTVLADLALDVRPVEIVPPDAEARILLNAAIEDFNTLLPTLSELELRKTIRAAENYVTWCRLLHPDYATAARANLETDMKDPKGSLQNVHFAFAFLEDFDPKELAEYLGRREAAGGLDDDELRAAFSIRWHSPNLLETVEFVGRHRERLIADYGLMIVYWIEILARIRMGDTTSARMLLDEHGGLFQPEARAIIDAEMAQALGADPTVAFKSAYEATGTTVALESLVQAQVARKDYAGLARNAEELYRRTRRPDDLRVAARAYANSGDTQNFMRLAEMAPEGFLENAEIGTRYADLLFRQGEIRKAREVASILRAVTPRALDIELAAAIELGDWEDIGRIAGEYLKADVPALALIRAAHAAHAASQGSAIALAEKAVAAAPDDPNILLGAYLLAVGVEGEEEKPRLRKWFNRATELSGDAGPLQKVELKTILEQGTTWAERSKFIGKALMSGEVPLFVAAPGLRTSLLDLILRNLIQNSIEPDPRKIAPIPLFSGRREAQRIGSPNRIAFDMSALLTLGWLGLVEKALELSPEIFLAAGVLTELFEARRELREFQNSNIVRGREVQGAIAQGFLKVVPSSSIEDELNVELDNEMADLLRIAKAQGGRVVRPAPIHRRGTLDEDISAAPYLAWLTDLPSLLIKLVAEGRIDQRQAEEASRFFALQDRGWPTESSLSDDQPLYLDSLTIAHLQTVGLLGPTLRAFRNLNIHESVAEQARSILAFEKRAGESIGIIDDIRNAIRFADQKGRVTFGSQFDRPGHEDFEASSLFLLGDLSGVDCVAIDDRAMNKEFFAADLKGLKAPIASSLDIIEELRVRDAITDAERRHARHRLRRAGAMLVPVDQEELVHAVSQPESHEFRAIRNNFNLAALSEAPQFPSELVWFNSLFLASRKALIAIWTEYSQNAEVERRADAILSLRPDPANWVGAWHESPPPQWVDAVTSVMAFNLAFPSELTGGERIKAYNDWIERKLLRPLRSMSPDRYAAVVEHMRTLILSLKEEDGEDGDDNPL